MEINETPFKEFPKIARFNRDVIITEKIDGTNGLIYMSEDLNEFKVGSRTRWITPDNDNHGFAKWAYLHRAELRKLGKGYHYGEWWGNGIQRGYGLPKDDKRFSLFNVSRWLWSDVAPPLCCDVVPVLYRGLLNDHVIETILTDLKCSGSKVVPFMNPEGIVIWHTASNTGYKITLENDEKPKAIKEIDESSNKSDR